MNWRGIVQLGEPDMRVRVMKEFNTRSGAHVKIIPSSRGSGKNGSYCYKVIASNLAGEVSPMADVTDHDLDVAEGDVIDLELRNVNFHLRPMGSPRVSVRGEGVLTDDGPGHCRIASQSVNVVVRQHQRVLERVH